MISDSYNKVGEGIPCSLLPYFPPRKGRQYIRGDRDGHLHLTQLGDGIPGGCVQNFHEFSTCFPLPLLRIRVLILVYALKVFPYVNVPNRKRLAG